MAKSVGIDLGEHAVKVVEIDGSYRKTRLVRRQVQRMSETVDGAARAEAAAEAVKAAMTEGRIGGRDLRLGHPCREAVLRTIDLPFEGRDAIRKVVKSEVEGQIHSHAVDDMVVDFHVVQGSPQGSRVLVAAVPKAGLRAQLQALERQGIEPESVDLDTMALYRLAHWCGAFEETAAGIGADAGAEAVVPASQSIPKARAALLDVGARSTQVLLVEDGNLVDMRSLRLGTLSVAEEVARAHGIPLPAAEVAVQHCLATGEDCDTESETHLPAPAAADDAGDDEEFVLETEETAAPAATTAGTTAAGTTAATAIAVRVRAAAVNEARHACLTRLQRELLRFLASAGQHGRVDTVWTTGGGARMPGMHEMLGEAFACEVRPLDVLARLQHDLSPEEAAELAPTIGIALGLALGAFGGPEGFDLRQEDLTLRKGFDRIKFPLAICCMVALFTTVVWGVKLNNDLKNLEYQLGRTFPGGRGTVFYGALNAILPKDGSWFADPKNQIERDQYRKLVDDVARLEVKDRIRHVRNWLQSKVATAQKDSGIYENLNLESGLAVLVRFSEMLQAKEPELGRYLLTKIDLNVPAGKGGRSLFFTVAFRGGDFRQRQGIIRTAIEEECRRPDSPFQQWDEASFKEHRFADADQTGVEGAYFDMRILLKDTFQPFGSSEVGR